MEFIGMFRILALVAVVVTATTTDVVAQGTATGDDPAVAALLTARATSEGFIASGKLGPAGTILLTSLREIPNDSTALLDVAYGNVQLILFLMEYLMPVEMVAEFSKAYMDVSAFETDRLVAALYNIYVVDDVDAVALATQEMTYLTSSTHTVVRAIALFNASNPFFYRNDAFNTQYARVMSEEYGGSEISQVAQILPLLQYRKSGTSTKLAQKSIEVDRNTTHASWVETFLSNVQHAFGATGQFKDEKEVLSPLKAAVTDAPEWQERYWSLLMLEDHLRGGTGEDVRPVAKILATRKGLTKVTPDVLRARVLLARLNARDCLANTKNSEASEACFLWCQSLLDCRVDTLSFERCLWEDRMKGIRNSARDLKKSGYLDKAETLYGALALEYPNSLVATQCNAEIAEIQASR